MAVVGGTWRDGVGVCVLCNLVQLGSRQHHLASLTDILCYPMALQLWTSLCPSLPVDSVLFVWCRWHHDLFRKLAVISPEAKSCCHRQIIVIQSKMFMLHASGQWPPREPRPPCRLYQWYLCSMNMLAGWMPWRCCPSLVPSATQWSQQSFLYTVKTACLYKRRHSRRLVWPTDAATVRWSQLRTSVEAETADWTVVETSSGLNILF